MHGPHALSDPLKHLSLVHGDAGLVVTVRASGRLALRRAFVALRRATGDVLWSVDLDGEQDAQFVIPRDELLRGFEEVWPDHVAAAGTDDGPAPLLAADRGAPPLIADLGFTIEADRELGSIRPGTHDYAALGVRRGRMDASRGMPSASGLLTAYLRRGRHQLHVRAGAAPGPLEGQRAVGPAPGDLVGAPRRAGDRELRGHGRLDGPRPPAVRRALHAGHDDRVRRRARVARGRAPAAVHGDHEQHQLLGRFDRPELMDAHFEAALWGYDDPPGCACAGSRPGATS